MNNNSGVPNFDPGMIEEAEKQAEEDRQNASAIQPKILEGIAFLERLKGASKEARERLKEQTEQVETFLKVHMNHGVPVVRRAAWTAILEFELTRPVESRVELEALLLDLVKRNFLQETPKGDLQAYGKLYQVHPESQFGNLEKVWVKTLLRDLVGKIKEGFLAGTTLTIEELFDGLPGECAVEVPPEKVTQNGQPLWLKGGVLRVKSDGEYIVPEDAMGGIEAAIQQARELKIGLQLQSLKRTNPPFIKGLEPTKGNKIRLLWYLLQRAKRLDEERRAFPGHATVSPEQFFLEGEPGICLVNLCQEVWEVKDAEGNVVNRIHSIFFLVSREEKEGTKKIHIVEVPNHLVDLFAPCMGEYEEGNKFAGCPWPLMGVLRTSYRQTLKVSQDAKKAG